MALKIPTRNRTKDAPTDAQAPATADLGGSDVVDLSDAQGSFSGPMPSSGFDLLEGKGRAKQNTILLNKITIGVAVLVVIGSAFVAYSVRNKAASLEQESAALSVEVTQITQRIIEDSRTVLNEEGLRAHRDARRDVLFRAAMSIPVDDILEQQVFRVANDLGIKLRTVDLEGRELEVTGYVDRLDPLVAWDAALNARLGQTVPGGFVINAASGYRDNDRGDEPEKFLFTTTIDVDATTIQTLVACRTAQFYLDSEESGVEADGPIADCPRLLDQFGLEGGYPPLDTAGAAALTPTPAVPVEPPSSADPDTTSDGATPAPSATPEQEATDEAA